MKRLLCIISCMNSGGAETFLMKLYRNLDRTKYQMDFCVNIEQEGFYDKEIKSLGGRIFYVPPKSSGVGEFRKRLSELIKREKYQYVLRITSNAAGFMDLMVAKKAGAEVTAARSSNSSDGVGLKAKLVHYISRILYSKYVDVKFAPSDLAAEYTFGKKTLQKGEATLLHNAVDLDVYKYCPEEARAIKKELGIEGKTVIGHIGRFDRQKNHAFLLDIFCEIIKKNSDARLLLVGGKGNCSEQIQEKIEALGLSDYVIKTGVRSDIPALLSAMDVLVMPSFYEGMPNTVIESEATGLPCVISDTITKQADITGLVSYLPLSASPKAWADKALSVMTADRKDTKPDFIKNKYDIQSVAKEFETLIFEKKA